MRRTALFAAALVAAGCGQPAEPVATPQPVAAAAEPPAPPAPPPTPPPADPDAAPPKTKTAPVSALTNEIYLPKGGGKWPAAFAPAAPAVDGKSVRLALEHGFHEMVVSPESGRFLIAQTLGKRVDKTQNNSTRFILGDVKAGKVLGQWDVAGQFAPLDLSADGTRFAVKASFWHSNALTVFTVSPDFKLSGKNVDAHDRIVLNPNAGGGKDAGLNVRWAGFVGTNRVASASEDGQVRVFSADTLLKIGTLEGTTGLAPTVTPDRKRLLAHAAGMVVLIDPTECAAVATKAWPLPSGPTALAASPDGKTLACAKYGRVRFLGLTSGEVWDQMIPQFGDPGMQTKHFGWCGPEFLVVNRKVYDPGVSYPVWQLTHQSHADGYSSRQVWAAARVPGPEAKSGPPIQVAVRAHNPLPPDLAGIVSAGKARPGIYILPAGAAVKVDVSKLPATKQAVVKADLEVALRVAGYTPSTTAAPVLSATLDPAESKMTEYNGLTNVPFMHQPLRVQFRHEGKVLYQHTWVKTPPGLVVVAGGQTLAGKAAADGWGQPNYEALKRLEVPPHFPGGAFPRMGFGFSELGPETTTHRSGR